MPDLSAIISGRPEEHVHPHHTVADQRYRTLLRWLSMDIPINSSPVGWNRLKRQWLQAQLAAPCPS
eukprot:1004962-Pleurochrysis_carterae.AAC.7